MASNRSRYKCINVDHETYRVIRSLARAHRRSLIEQVRVMADVERKTVKARQLFPDNRARRVKA
jgi:hypothetical protein